MKVKMKTTTNWKGKLRKPGEILTVDEAVAERWKRYGLAEVIGEKKGKKELATPDDGLESLTLVELRKLAEDEGLAPGNMKKDDLITLIRTAQRPPAAS